MKTLAFGLVAFLSLGVTAYAVITYALMPLGAVVHPDMRANFEAHRRWMARNFSLTFAAMTLRLRLPAAMLSRVPFELAYPVIAWLCRVPNLLVARVLVRRSLIPVQSHAPVSRDT